MNGFFFFFQAEDGIRDKLVTGVQTCALPIWSETGGRKRRRTERSRRRDARRESGRSPAGTQALRTRQRPASDCRCSVLGRGMHDLLTVTPRIALRPVLP